MTIPDKASEPYLMALIDSDKRFTGRRVEIRNGQHSSLLCDWEPWDQPDRVQFEYIEAGKIKMTRSIEVVR